MKFALPYKRILAILQTSAGMSFYGMSQLLLVILVARFFGVNELGELALILALTIPLQTICNLSFRHYQSIDVGEKFSLADFLHLRIFSIGLFSILTLALGLVLEQLGAVSFVLTVSVVWLRCAESLSDLSQGALNRHSLHRIVAISGLLRGAVAIVAYAIGILVFRDLAGAVLAAGLCIFIVIVLIDCPAVIRASQVQTGEFRKVHWPKIHALFQSTWPLGLTHTIVIFYPNIPRYFLNYFNGHDVLGTYTIIVTFVTIGQIFVTASCFVMLRNLALAHGQESREEFCLSVKKLMMLALGVGIVGVFGAAVFGEWALRTIFGDGFVMLADDLLAIMIAAIFLYLASVIAAAVASIGRFEVFVKAYCVSTIFGVFVAAISISSFGLSGAIFSFGASAVLNTGASFYLIFRNTNFS